MSSSLYQNEEYLVNFQKQRKQYIRISLLNKDNNEIDVITGNAVGGNINIDANKEVRRSCDVDLAITNSSFLVNEDKKIWINRRVKIEIGLYSVRTDDIIWFNKGYYAISEPSVTYTANEKNLSFSGLDFMSLLNGELGGELTHVTRINAGADISEAIRTLARLGGITKLRVENINKTIPYDLEKNAGDTIYSMMKEIAELYMDWELYFDEDGYLVFSKIRNKLNDAVKMTFDDKDNNNLNINYNISYDWNNVKNYVKIWGYTNEETGLQIEHLVKNEDVNDKFSIPNIGEKIMVVNDENIFDLSQAEIRGKYELYKHGNMCDKLSFNCVPYYFLDANDLMQFNIHEIELYDKYIIDSISIPLTIGEMSISCHRIY